MAVNIGGTVFGSDAQGGQSTMPSLPTVTGFVGHGSAEHGAGSQSSASYAGSTFIPTHGMFGLTPPGSRSNTPPRARTPSNRRRTRGDRSDSERSREGRSPRSPRQGPRGYDDEQQLPTGWGARMLTAERRISAQDNQIRNLQAIVESTNA